MVPRSPAPTKADPASGHLRHFETTGNVAAVVRPPVWRLVYGSDQWSHLTSLEFGQGRQPRRAS